MTGEPLVLQSNSVKSTQVGGGVSQDSLDRARARVQAMDLKNIGKDFGIV